ncbi:MAG TPA: PASTA domain-containing protein [Gaiellaceae bacterium]
MIAVLLDSGGIFAGLASAPSTSGGYALFVGGAQTRILDSRARVVTIRVRVRDTRSFSVAAVDTVGNVGPRTRSVVLVPQLVGLTLKETKAAADDPRFVIRWVRSAPGKPQPYVVAQIPAAPSIVAEGSSVTVVAGAKPIRSGR